MRQCVLALLFLPMLAQGQTNPNYDPDHDLNGCYTMLDILSLLVILLPDNAGLDVPNPNYDPDFEGDGAIGVSDLVGLLTVFGTCVEEELCVSPTMDGYTYTVAQIGSQCWFAENLQTTLYADGSTIASATDAGEWAALDEGAWAVYDNDEDNAAAHGHLYNGFAFQDDRGLCPTGWHVPDDGEWQQLESTLGMPSGELELFGTFRGTVQGVGTALKSTSGWSGNGNGTDLFGFAATPGGTRSGEEPGAGNYNGLGDAGFWWTSSVLDEDVSSYVRSMLAGSTGVLRNAQHLRYGLSVRCVLDD